MKSLSSMSEFTSRDHGNRVTLCLVLALALVIVWGSDRIIHQRLGKENLTGNRSPSPPAVSAENRLLKFTAGSHVLGFSDTGVWIAALDHVLRVRFVGARLTSPSANNTLPDDGRPQALGRVSYNQLWKGIDLVYESTPGKILKSTYRLDAGAAVERICLKYNQAPRIDPDGSLNFSFNTGRFSEAAPVAWQEIGGRRLPVEVAFRKISESEVGFRLGAYDRSRAVTIDPAVQWSTFLGANMSDESNGIFVSGNTTYVVGTSGASWGFPIRPYSGGKDVFVAKLDNEGNLVWHTFLGGPEDDNGSGIVVGGNIYVIGDSRSSWGSPERAYQGNCDAFVAKITPGGALSWNTFLGSTGQDDYGKGIAFTSGGDVVVTGYSYGSWGSPVRPFSDGIDAFVARLDENTGILSWNTFLGSSGGDRGLGVVCGSAIYVAGYSNQTWGVTPLRAHSGGSDAFLAALDFDGNLVWHTFLGSDADDFGRGIAQDVAGNIYVVGNSRAEWRGSSPPVRPFSGSSDVFVAKFSSHGLMAWNTFLGSANDDVGYGIAVYEASQVYVTGYSDAAWGDPVSSYSGNREAFLARLNSTGALQWNTFLGSLQSDDGYGVALTWEGEPRVAGRSAASWGSPRRTCTGHDAFVARVDDRGYLVWNTFLGSASDDDGRAIALDSGGNVYVAGFSRHSWGSPRRAHRGGYDAFAAKLDPGGILLWNTFLGSAKDDKAYGLALDGDGNLYVAGESADTWGSPRRAYSGSTDAFVAKLNNNGTLLWNTFLGSVGPDTAYAVGVGSEGAPHVTGSNSGRAFVARLESDGAQTWDTYPIIGPAASTGEGLAIGRSGQIYVAGTISGEGDAFVVSLNSSGERQWTTLLGTPGYQDNGHAITRDEDDNLYVTGSTYYGFGSPIRSCTVLDAFVAKLDSSGNLLWNTCLGSPGHDQVVYQDRGQGVTVDSRGDVYVVGSSEGHWGFISEPHKGGYDAFIAKLSTNGALIWNTFQGSASYDYYGGHDYGYGIAVDSRGMVHLTGSAYDRFGSPILASQGDDAFVIRLGLWLIHLPKMMRAVPLGVPLEPLIQDRRPPLSSN